jgi:hypothetical protein
MTSSILWYLLDGKAIEKKTHAPDVATARAIFGVGPNALVVSAVSYEIGAHPGVVWTAPPECKHCRKEVDSDDAAPRDPKLHVECVSPYFTWMRARSRQRSEERRLRRETEAALRARAKVKTPHRPTDSPQQELALRVAR